MAVAVAAAVAVAEAAGGAQLPAAARPAPRGGGETRVEDSRRGAAPQRRSLASVTRHQHHRPQLRGVPAQRRFHFLFGTGAAGSVVRTHERCRLPTAAELFAPVSDSSPGVRDRPPSTARADKDMPGKISTADK